MILYSLLVAQPALAVDGPSTFSEDVKPEPPGLNPSGAGEVRTYAGVGGGIAYAERGVGEFGGSIGFSSSPGVRSLSADPSVGFFIFDNVQLSAIAGYQHVNLDGEDASNRLSLIFEPSLHTPFNDTLFFALGLGVGPALTDGQADDGSWVGGVAIAPRTGLQLLVGRSGILNLGVRYSAVISGVDADVQVAGGQAILSFVNTLDVQTGYTVMF